MILFGESAGSVSISAYSFAYKDDPLVRGFIMQSGVAQGIGDADEGMWTLAAGNVGCLDAEQPGSDKEIECMMSLSAEKIMSGITNMTVNPIGTPNGGSPFVDNVTVWSVEDYQRLAEEGQFAKLVGGHRGYEAFVGKFANVDVQPVLLGSNDDEGQSVVNFSPETGVNQSLAEDITISRFTCLVSNFSR